MQPLPDEFDSLLGRRLPEGNKSKVIVIVDDDEDMIRTVASIGRKAGYTVFGASSGEECLSVLWRVTPQLIMLDVNMAALDGFETCRRVRGYRNFSNVPIAFLTARKTPADVKRCIAAGGDDFIVKPFNGTQLIERIEFLISRNHLLSVRRARRAEKLDTLTNAPPRAVPTTVAAAASANDPSFTDARSKAGPTASSCKNQDIPAELWLLPDVALEPLVPFLVKKGGRTGPGLIAPAFVALWWDALMSMSRGPLTEHQRDLDRLQQADDAVGVEALSRTVRGLLATLTVQLAELVAQPRPPSPPSVTSLAMLGAAAEVRLIGEVLLVADPLHEAIHRFNLALSPPASGSAPIGELSPALVGEGKKCYAALGDGGVAARLFVVAILNRLEKPWQIFRLVRAISLNPSASVISGTELGIIGERLLFGLGEVAAAVDATTAKPWNVAAPIDFDGLLSLVAHYCDIDEGLVNEIEIGRDSPWGAALLRARAKMCSSLDEDRLRTIAKVVLLPIQARHNTGLAASGATTRDAAKAENVIATANAAGALRFIAYAAQRGEKFGFSTSARRVLDGLREDVADCVETTLRDHRANPIRGLTPAYLEGALTIVDILCKDDRGQLLADHLNAVLRDLLGRTSRTG